MKKKIKVLFVCLGNICRSPAAEGIMRHLAAQEPSLDIHIESCGLGDWHIGKEPDLRMCEAAINRGFTLTSRAQKIQKEWLDDYDHILVADQKVMQSIQELADTPKRKSKVVMMTEYSKHYKGQDVPDPYFGGQAGFELVLDMLEESCKGLIKHIHRS